MTLVGTERGSRVCMACPLPRVRGFRLNLRQNRPGRAAARGSRALVKALEDEAQSLDVVPIARRLRDAQDGPDPFAVGGAVLDHGKVTRHGGCGSWVELRRDVRGGGIGAL